MTTLHMAWTELRRVTGTTLGKAALLALVLVPTLYAGLYLYANRDPYANLDQVPAALVMEDRGATDAEGEPLEYGDDIAQELVDQDSFDFRETDRATALEGVDDGTYDFALVIPRDFSASLAGQGVDPDGPESTRIRMVTNDAHSYLSTTIANQLVVDVREAIAEEVSQKAASTFLLGLSDVRETLLESADGVRDLGGDLDEVGQVSGTLSEDTTELAGEVEALAELLGGLEVGDVTGVSPDGLGAVRSQARSLGGAAGRAFAQSADAQAASGVAISRYADGRAELDALMDDQEISDEDQAAILAVFDRAGRGLAPTRSEVVDLRSRVRDVAALAARVEAAAGAVTSAPGRGPDDDSAAQLDEAADTAAEVSGALEELGETSVGMGTSLERLTEASDELTESLSDSARRIPATDEEGRAGIARTLSDPVEVRAASASADEGDGHGAGLAPLVLALAAWIGAVVLFWLVRPLSRRALAGNAPSWRTAVGGWLAPAFVALVQAGLLMGATVLVVEIDPGRVPATVGLLILVSMTFVAITHALCAWLGVTGLFLALVLMFLQAITAGGTFPWETTPAPLHPLHDVLPMSYAVDGLRQLMFGGYSDRLLLTIGVLAAWLAGALLVTVLAARHQRVWTPRKVAPDVVLR